jgi:endonuclease/exonuclease/phosphatase family metal-dependent hydrolase
MRLLSYNIWNYEGHWSTRRFLLADLIARLNPDIVALQEVRHSWRDLPGNNQARWLARQLGYRAYFRPANVYIPIPPIVEGLAFLSRSPCDRLTWRSIPAFPSAGPPRVILHGTWGRLEVFNVHFPLREKARNLAADVLIDFSRTVGSARSIALGDFNARLEEEPMNRLFRGGFADLWPALSPAVSWPEDDRIDYVLGCSATTWTGSIHAVGDTADERSIRASDHLGILADLEYT